MGIKGSAYFLTASVGLLSDALESLINLTAALLAVRLLAIAAAPPDENHAYGHHKAEYFSSLLEGSLILAAAGGIIYTATPRLFSPPALERLELGLAIVFGASLINLLVARLLLRMGRQHNSIALEADGHHLMSDFWTSVAVIAGVGATSLTRLAILDPVVAIVVALRILWTGYDLLRRSIEGLMDTALPTAERERIIQTLESLSHRGFSFHALRTRRAGNRTFISLHLQTPGDWSIQEGHDLAEEVERSIRRVVPRATIFTHVEPLEDPRSWTDEGLDPHEPEPGQGDSTVRR
jgi:cation diffusion facilitator family transporter